MARLTELNRGLHSDTLSSTSRKRHSAAPNGEKSELKFILFRQSFTLWTRLFHCLSCASRQVKEKMKLLQQSPAAVLAAATAIPASPALGLPNSAGGCVSPPPPHLFAANLRPPVCPADILDKCTALTKAGLANVLTPGTEAYESRTLTYWSITSQLTPWCIVSDTH